MKKIISLLLIYIALSFSLLSCSPSAVSTLDVITKFEREFNTGGRIYSSLIAEGEDGYISSDMREALFPEGLPQCEYSLLMYSTLGDVSELGIFALEDGGKALELMSVINDRLKLLSSFIEGESFIYEKGSVIAYGFFDNAEEAKKLLKSLM